MNESRAMGATARAVVNRLRLSSLAQDVDVQETPRALHQSYLEADGMWRSTPRWTRTCGCGAPSIVRLRRVGHALQLRGESCSHPWRRSRLGCRGISGDDTLMKRNLRQEPGSRRRFSPASGSPTPGSRSGPQVPRHVAEVQPASGVPPYSPQPRAPILPPIEPDVANQPLPVAKRP
jgi:hypothetical protein